jgi:hypothetical protein
VAQSYNALGRYVDAEMLLRPSLAMSKQKLPDDWTTFHAMSLLGHSLARQMKFTEAEPLLLEGYQGMKQREDRIAYPEKRYLIVALDSLVQLYEALGKPEEAAKWRKELEAMKKSEKKPAP